MKVIIAGAGAVGYHLAKLLTKEKHSIVLIDTNAKVLQRAENELDLLTIHGNAYALSVLDEADITNTDLLIAVSSSETANLTIASLGKQLGAKRTIARVSNIEFVKLRERLDFQGMGIDVIISPEDLAAKEIRRLLRRSSFTDVFDFEFGKLTLLGTYLKEGSALIGTTIEELNSRDTKTFISMGVERLGNPIIPFKGFRFEENDHAFFLCLRSGIEEIRELAGGEEIEVNNVMIMGGGNVGYNIAKMLSRKKSVKIIESDYDRSQEIASKLESALVINDDGHDVRLLEDENIGAMDAFIGVTGNSETNIMSCLVAKNHGVKKTIAMVENMDYIHLSQNIGIDTLINKKLIAANNIFRYVRKGGIINIAGIHGMDAEVLEISVAEKSKATKHPLRRLGFPKDAIVGGVVRGDQAWIADGDFQLEAGDKIVVFALPNAIKKTLRFFQR